MKCPDSATFIILSVVASIVLLESMAMLVMNLDGVALSASIGALTTIALKRQELHYKLRSVKLWRSPQGTL